jgi:NAD(P)-dependent dehydrogenase (short-subunit alcohol dehydrogenase family)
VSERDDDRQLLTEAPDPGLEGLVVWLSGASRGLGRTLACAFAAVGAQLLLCTRSIREHGGTAEVLVGSIADPAVIEQAAEIIGERWGHLNALVNAGISPAFPRAERLDLDVWRDVLDINLSAPMIASRAALPLFEQAGGGSIVNVSSVYGARAHERLIAYAASEGGLEMVAGSRRMGRPRHPRQFVAPGYWRPT